MRKDLFESRGSCIQELFPRPWAILRPAGGADASAAAAEAAAHHDPKHRSCAGCDAQLIFLETWRCFINFYFPYKWDVDEWT